MRITHDQLAPHGPISDLKIKHFNSILKNIKQFYEQMSDGDSVLSQFSELAIYKTHKSTKGAYCKRKASHYFAISSQHQWSIPPMIRLRKIKMSSFQ